MNQTASTNQSAAFARAREAVLTLKNIKPALNPGELETLTLLMDSEFVETLEQSSKEAKNGQFESLEDAVTD